MATTKKSRTLSCPECHLVVARPSHLARHIQSHLPPSRREHFSCGECGRQFSRNDVLLRHLRTAHQAYISRKKSAQKSCFRCVQKKLKCDRGHPCISCAKSSSMCKYPAEEPFDEPDVKEGKIETSPKADLSLEDNGSGQHSSFASSDGFANASTQGPDNVPGLVGHTHTAAQSSSISQTFSSHTAQFIQPGTDSFALGMVHSDLAAFQTTSPTTTVHDYNQSMMNFDSAYLQGDLNFMSNPPRIAGMAEGGVDWLNLELDSPNAGDYAAQTIGQVFNNGLFQPVHAQPWASIGSESPFCNKIQSTIPARVDLPSTQETNCPPNKVAESQTSAQQWPFDHTRNPEPQKYRLPPLRQILQGTITSDGQDSGNTAKSLVQLLSDPVLPEISLVQDLNMMSALDLLKNSLDLYFSEFHSVLPVIHIPTFNMARVPTVTLAAMSCIGAMYSDDRLGTDQSWSLSEMCLQMIAWLGGADSTNYYDPSYLIASCLHQIYSLGSGNRRLYQNADCSRGILIGCLRGMGLLKSRISTEIEKEDFRNTGFIENPANEWLRWKDQEQDKRIAWSAFEYDCSLSTLTSRRAAVDLPELPSHLPCAEPLWDAPTAQAWSALYSRLSPTARGAPTAKILRNILAGKAIPEDLPAWSKRLCAQKIGRLLWDLKQLDIMSTTEYLKLPSLSAAQRQTKSVLLQGLNALCESIYNPSSTAELIHYNITSLTCHYSHLYSADEVMDLVVHIFRISASQGKQPDYGLIAAKRRLRSIFIRNPGQARRLAWHAAQMISVANEYLVSAPCEILRVFMGYIFLLAFAKFGPQPVPEASFDSFAIQLDLPNRIQGQRTAISTWIDVGGPASIGGVKNIYSDGGLKAISREAQTMLRKMRFWGLAKKFTRILESFDFDSD
ncbi:hypothetical protein ABEF95_006334 [Exophiala dermatitidis]